MQEVKSPITANVWKVEKQVGDAVEEGDVLVILESMKMEIPVEASCSGVIKEVLVQEGGSVVEEEVIARIAPS